MRLYGTPRSRASTQTPQEQPGRGVAVAPPDPRISTFTRPMLRVYWYCVSQELWKVSVPGPPRQTSVC